MRGEPRQRNKIKRKRGKYFKPTFETGMEAERLRWLAQEKAERKRKREQFNPSEME